MAKKPKSIVFNQDKYQVREDQSVELLKELHILTRDGKLNQDSRRKLKQIYFSLLNHCLKSCKKPQFV